MTNLFVFSQNVILESLEDVAKRCVEADKNIFLTSHMLFENEQGYLKNIFSNCEFYKFADFLSDEDNEECDYKAYDVENHNLERYFAEIKRRKNEKILSEIKRKVGKCKGYLLVDDLGIDESVFVKAGFERVSVSYYHDWPVLSMKQKLKALVLRNPMFALLYEKRVEKIRAAEKESITKEISVAYDENGKKYVFFGSTNRVGYRMNLEWKHSEEEYERVVMGEFEDADKCQYLSTLHERWKCPVPDDSRYDVRYIQDGYLPPNYSSKYLAFKPQNVRYYAWDVLGEKTFELFDIPVSVMPFRKKLYMPKPEFRDNVKTVLVATSGPGDWTAQKNRSDEDLMVEAFVEIARRFPEIDIIYRCHPTWIYPEHNGVNSIKRVAKYIQDSGLTNLRLSSSIPHEQDGEYTFSFPRSSFKEDLEKADIVFGEHSVSMLDAGFERIPFASVNLTGRRNLFCGITEMGFPHCESVNEIAEVLVKYSDVAFQEQYNVAVDCYNEMTDKE